MSRTSPFLRGVPAPDSTSGHAVTVPDSSFVVNLPEEVSVPSPLATVIFWARYFRRRLRASDAEDLIEAWDEYVASEPTRGNRSKAFVKHLPIEARRVIMEHCTEKYLKEESEVMPVSEMNDNKGVCLTFGHGDIIIAHGQYKDATYKDELLFIASTPHEIGAVAEIPHGATMQDVDTRVRMVFESVESLDVLIERAQALRQEMQEGIRKASSPIRNIATGEGMG